MAPLKGIEPSFGDRQSPRITSSSQGHRWVRNDLHAQLAGCRSSFLGRYDPVSPRTRRGPTLWNRTKSSGSSGRRADHLRQSGRWGAGSTPRRRRCSVVKDRESTAGAVHPWPLKALVSRTPQFQRFGDRDSNPDLLVQSQPSCHWTIPERRAPGGTRTPNVSVKSRLRFHCVTEAEVVCASVFVSSSSITSSSSCSSLSYVRRAHVPRRGSRRTRTLVQAVYGRGIQPVECSRNTKKPPEVGLGRQCLGLFADYLHSRPILLIPGQILMSGEITDGDL